MNIDSKSKADSNNLIRNTNDLVAYAHAHTERAFFAETDRLWAIKEDEEARPVNMAEHCASAWLSISRTVCPERNSEHVRRSFYLGYEDAATELAVAGEAGYEALAEVGTVADTDGWVLRSAPWSEIASDGEKAMWALLAARAGAVAWQQRFEATGNEGCRIGAEKRKFGPTRGQVDDRPRSDTRRSIYRIHVRYA